MTIVDKYEPKPGATATEGEGEDEDAEPLKPIEQ